MPLTLNVAVCLEKLPVALVPPLIDAVPSFSVEHNPYLFPASLLQGVSADSTKTTRHEVPPPEAPDEEDAQAAWWLVHTNPRQERKLAHKLRSLQISHFLPVPPHRALTRGRERITWAHYFPVTYSSVEAWSHE